MSRRTRLYRIGSQSITQRNRTLNQATRYASMVDSLAIALVKTLGSSLKENEWSITLTATEVQQAKPHERLNITEGPNGEVVLKVDIHPDLRAQVEAFKQELETVSATTSVVGEAISE